MVVTEFGFDPVKDLKAVEPFGFIDRANALATGIVPSQLPDSEVNYNGIEDPASILGKPKDIFEALAMESSINSYEPPKEDS